MTLQAAGEKALEIERDVGPSASHHELAEAFSRAAQALPETDSRREFLIWETWLHQYQLKRAGHDAPRGDELGPLFEAGNRRHPPRVRDFPAEALEYLQHRHTSAQIPSARARLADFLLVRTRDVSLAESAVAAYLDAAQAVIPGRHGVMAATEYLIRSAAISRSLGRDGADVRAAIRGLAAFLIHDGSGFLCILVRGTKAEIANDAELFDWLMGKLIRLADTAATEGGQRRFSERSFVTTAIELSSEKQDAALVKELRIRTVRSFELEADERAAEAPLIQSALLQEAMKAYGDLGLSADLQRVKPRVHEASERASADLKEISTSMTIPADLLRQEMQKLVGYGRQRAPWLHIQIFAVRGLWPAWSEVAERTAEYRRRFPLQSAVSRIILGPDNRPLPRPSDPVAARQFDEIEYYVRDVQLKLGLYLSELEMLRELQAWDVELLMQALGSGLMFSADTLSAIRPGVVAFEAGRYWEALHTLVPQIERVIRELAQMLGTNVYRYQSGTGEIYWSSLNTLLQLEPVKAVLTRIRPDLGNELKYLLIDSRGLNLRDDVAHGIVGAGQAAETRALLCLLILLILSVPRLAADATKDPA